MTTTTTVIQRNNQTSFLRNRHVTENRPYDYVYGKFILGKSNFY